MRSTTDSLCSGVRWLYRTGLSAGWSCVLGIRFAQCSAHDYFTFFG
jgi:hypothetical protein